MLNCKNKRKTSQLCFNLKEVHPRVLVVSNRPSKVPGQLGGLNLGMQSSDRLQQNGLQFNKKNHGLLRKLFKISVLQCTFNKMDCSWIKRTLVYRYYFQLKKSRLNMDWNEIEWFFSELMISILIQHLLLYGIKNGNIKCLLWTGSQKKLDLVFAWYQEVSSVHGFCLLI